VYIGYSDWASSRKMRMLEGEEHGGGERCIVGDRIYLDNVTNGNHCRIKLDSGRKLSLYLQGISARFNLV